MRNRGFTFHVKVSICVQYLHFKCLSFLLQIFGKFIQTTWKMGKQTKVKITPCKGYEEPSEEALR